jgi:hypothetical protein
MTDQAEQEQAAVRDRGALSFAEILAPVAPDTFFAEYHGRKTLHVPGAAGKFADMMSWPKLNALLNMTAVWTNHSFTMALDGAMVPPHEYCRPGMAHATGAAALQPDAARVTALLERGASLVLNDIDTFNPGLTAVARVLEEAFESRVQANLYCSWRERRAFPSHFDNHDVYALHVEGEKLWRVYEGRLDNPIAHPAFQGQPASFHEKAKGKIAAEILLKPGDLLYIPRGTYHDAIARSDGTIHVAFGATAMIGLDLVSSLFERAVHESLFRADFPRRHAPGGDKAFESHVRALASKLAEMAADPATLAHCRAFQDGYRYPRGGFGLASRSPAGFFANSATYRIVDDSFTVVRHGGDWMLRRGNKATAIPPGLDRPVAWIIERRRFALTELAAAFPDLGNEQRTEFLRSLEAMGMITPA